MEIRPIEEILESNIDKDTRNNLTAKSMP